MVGTPLLPVLAAAVTLATGHPDGAPSWSPDGRWLVFNRASETVLAHADGSRPRRMGYLARLVWTRDGRRLLVSGVGKDGIRLARPDGSRAQPVALGGLPSWSPDGGFFAFAQGTDIVIADSAGRTVRRLPIPRSPNCPKGQCNYGPSEVSWSPAGDPIAFALVSVSTASKGSSKLWAIAADGSGLRELPSNFAVMRLTWSPRGRRIAYLQYDDFEDNVLHVLDTATAVNTAYSRAQSFEWSPRGDMIASSGESPGFNSFVDLTRLKDGRRRRLVHATHASWSPDGRRLVFARGTDIVIADRFGKHQRKVARGVWPAWSPRGATIAFAAAACGPRQGIWLLRVATGVARRVTRGCTIGR